MYELAIRHMLGKPVIIIANKQTKLPFDTLSYRTIFYDYSEDGLSALKNQISTAVTEIDFTEITSPVIDLMPLNCKEKRVFSSTCTGLSDAMKLIDSIAEQNKHVEQASNNS